MGKAGLGKAGWARRDSQGGVRPGEVWHGAARRGEAVKARRGRAWQGGASLGVLNG